MSSVITIPINPSNIVSSANSNKNARSNSTKGKPSSGSDTIIILSSPPPLQSFPPKPQAQAKGHKKKPKKARQSSSHFFSTFLAVVSAIAFCIAAPIALLMHSNPAGAQKLIADIKQVPNIFHKLVSIGKSIEKQHFDEQVAWIGDIGNELKKGKLKENTLKLNSYLSHTNHLLDRANQNGLLSPELVDKVSKQVSSGWTGWLLGTRS